MAQPPRKFTDALDQPITQPKDIVMPATGDIDDMRETLIERVTDLPNAARKADLLAFAEEKLSVMIHEASDQNPENFVFLAVNGRGPGAYGDPWVPRGVAVNMARKFVERLARAKVVNIRTVEAADADGARTMAIKRSASLRYPFSILSDPNPQGAQWLRTVMAEV